MTTNQLEFEFVTFTTTNNTEKITIREVLADRFKAYFKNTNNPQARLLAIRLDGFSHRAFYDMGLKSAPVECDAFSGCMPERRFPELARALFHDIGHAGYQGAPREIVYILPQDR